VNKLLQIVINTFIVIFIILVVMICVTVSSGDRSRDYNTKRGCNIIIKGEVQNGNENIYIKR